MKAVISILFSVFVFSNVSQARVPSNLSPSTILKKKVAHYLPYYGKKNKMSFDLDSLECMGVFSFAVDNVVVGNCLVEGDLNYPNSSTVFSITVYQVDPEFEKTKIVVRPITGEI